MDNILKIFCFPIQKYLYKLKKNGQLLLKIIIFKSGNFIGLKKIFTLSGQLILYSIEVII